MVEGPEGPPSVVEARKYLAEAAAKAERERCTRNNAIAATRAVMLPDLCTAYDIARLAGVTEATVRRWFCRGELPGRRVGRTWLADRTQIMASLRPQKSKPTIRMHESS